MKGHWKGVFHIMETNKITLCIKVRTEQKPTEQEIKRIQTKSNSIIAEVTPSYLAAMVTNGHSIHAPVCNMKQGDDTNEATAKTFKKASFLFQNIFALDIDHGDFTQEELLNLSLVKPNIIYQSYSSCPESKRWRIVYFANKTITNFEVAEKVNSLLMTPFLENLEDFHGENADIKTVDATRVFYSGKSEHLYIDEESRFNPFDVLNDQTLQERYERIEPEIKELKSIKRKRNALAKKAHEKKLITDEEYNQYLELKEDKVATQVRYDKLNELAAHYEELIKSKLKDEAKTQKTEQVEETSVNTLTGEILTDFEFDSLEEVRNVVMLNLSKVNTNGITQMSYHDANLFISKLPLNDLLNVRLGQNFKCLFHVEESPSASIFVGRDGKTIYKCHSGSCGITFNTYTFLIHLVNMDKNLLRRNSVQAILNPMGIKLIRNEFEVESKLQLADCAAFVGEIDDKDPLKKRLIKKNLHELYFALIRYAHTLVTDEPLKQCGEEVVIHASMMELYDYMRKNNVAGTSNFRVFAQKIKFLNYLGMFEVVKFQELKSKYHHIAIINKKEKNHKLKSYYQFPVVDEFVWDSILEKFMVYENSGAKFKDFSANQLTAVTNVSTSRNTFIQSKLTDLNNDELDTKQSKLLNQLIKKANELIEKQKYFTEDQLIGAVDRNGKLYSTVKERKKASKHLILSVKNKLNLEQDTVKKSTRQTYNIPTRIADRKTIFISGETKK